MPDVFISYSRRDLEFVQRLHASLDASGKDVWVDWQDILPTAEWLEEVFEGVESSDNFLFVISPDSLTSEVCARELGHALEQRKRLVPVLRRDADREPMPEALAARNWTFFRDQDDYGASFEALVSALDTDLEWVSAHTRLLGRALEWEREGRDGSYLLRGRDLADAERWVASQTAERDPQPTPLQLEYTLAGRRAATRRQRILVGAALVAVAVSLSLALLALFQRNEARREARIALSRQLAAEAIVARDNDPEQSLALATRAAATAETDEALEALRRSLRSSFAVAEVPVGTARARVWDAAFSPDGRRLVTASGGGGVRIWDVRRPRSPHLVVSLHADPPLSSARFSPDGRFVVTAGPAGAQIWRAASGTREPAASFGSDANMATFSPDGRLVASAAEDGLHLWSVKTKRPVGELSQRAGRRSFVAVAFSSDGRRIAAGAGSTAEVWSVPAGRRLAVLPHPLKEKVWDVAFRPGGKQVVTADTAGVARVWQVPSGELKAALTGHTDALQSAAFSSDGRFLVTAGDDATARVWDVETRRTVAELLGHNGPVLTASFRRGDQLIVTGGDDGKMRLWPSPNRPIFELPIPEQKRVTDVDFSPDGQRLVTASEDGTGRVWNDESPLRTLHHGRRGVTDDWVETATFSHDGSRILTAGVDGTAKVWSTETGSLLAKFGTKGGQPLFTADLSWDGAYVAAAGEGGDVRIWKVAGGRPDTRKSQTRRIDGVAFSPDGELLASAGWDGALRLWDVAGGKAPVATLQGDRNPLWGVAFSPDGERVAAGGSSGSVWVWDVRTHDLVSTLAGRRTAVWRIGFSRDGRFLVTAGGDGVARVFAAESGRPVAQLPTRAESLEAAAFSPVAWSIAVAGDRGEAAVLDCVECRPLDELLCLADDRLTPRALAMLPRDARDAIDSRRAQCHSRR